MLTEYPEARGPQRSPEYMYMQLWLKRKLSFSVAKATNQNQSLGQNSYGWQIFLYTLSNLIICSNAAINAIFRFSPF